ncbi:MAG: hypothetical protein WDO16_24125 [Bacteroidota bacterium]
MKRHDPDEEQHVRTIKVLLRVSLDIEIAAMYNYQQVFGLDLKKNNCFIRGWKPNHDCTTTF